MDLDLLLMEKGDIYIVHSNPLQPDNNTLIIKTFPAFGDHSENWQFYNFRKRPDPQFSGLITSQIWKNVRRHVSEL